MRTIALVSGGKDSILSMLMAYAYGHEPSVIVNIIPDVPPSRDTDVGDREGDPQSCRGHDIDSYMYQTVGYEAVEHIAACLEVPLRRVHVAAGDAKDLSLYYSETPAKEDEVEVLFRLLKSVQEEFPEVEGVTSGAILSNYQRNRVEYICDRLGLLSLAYLWMRQPEEILDMAKALHVEAILVKTASIGLDPRKLVGKTLEEARPLLERMAAMYQSHIAGEGGEYESTVLNCPLFRHHRLEVEHIEVLVVDDNPISTSGHGLLQLRRVEKTEEEKVADTALLAKLRNGELHFPSDELPLLQALHSGKSGRGSSSGFEKCSEVPLATELPFTGLAAGVAAAFGRGFLWKSVDGAPGSEKKAMNRVLEWLKGERLAPVLCLCTSETHDGIAPLRRAYEDSFPHICAPSGTFVVDSGIPSFSVSVIGAPLHLANQNVLHAQSRSCWGLGCQGPYAQGRAFAFEAVDEDDDAVLHGFVGPAPGRIPATWKQAMWEDFSFEGFPGNLRPESLPFAAQFSVAAANCAAYLGCLKRNLADVTDVLVMCKREIDLGEIATLWQWIDEAACAQGASREIALKVLRVDGFCDESELVRVMMRYHQV